MIELCNIIQNFLYNFLCICCDCIFLVTTMNYVASDSAFPPGLTLMENFITEEQEETLLRTLNWDECGKIDF